MERGFYLLSGLVCEEKMPMGEACAVKLGGSIAHIGDFGVEDNISVGDLAHKREAVSAPIGERRLAAGYDGTASLEDWPNVKEPEKSRAIIEKMRAMFGSDRK